MAKKKYDFSGYATKNDLQCSDGRIIRKDAFLENDGITVPLVWQHIHDDPNNVLGHALLENREDGVYCYCAFNDTEAGQNSKTLVAHGDVRALSIYAKNLQQQGSSVLHGAIKEVSLVLAGANPGAFIDNVEIQHSDSSITTVEDEAVIFSDEQISIKPIEHDDMQSTKEDGEETVQDVFDTLTDKQKDVVYIMLSDALGEGEESSTVEHADTTTKKENVSAKDPEEETVQDVFDTLTDKQKNVVYAMLADALGSDEEDEESKGTNGDKKTITHSIEGGNIMKNNAFDKTTTEDKKRTLSHSEVEVLFKDAKKAGSLREAFLAHAVTYGIENIDFLFPDARLVNGQPEIIKRDDVWVEGVLSAANHTPFSRIKSTAADITADEARAKGYLKGGLKKEEVIKLLKRVTTPTTIYKKQKLDRDDIVDIVDLDIVVWLKAEMRAMLNEEIARAVLIGDGRSEASPDKVNDDNIRPIYLDDAIYAPHVDVSAEPDAMVDDILRAKKQYKGSGNPTFYTSQDNLIEMLLVRDTTGRKLYPTVTELCLALGVSKIVEVPVMEGVSRMGTESTPLQHDLIGIIVNLKDYTIGADKGGAINMFDDFDIDYNQQKYLMETRCSGALTKPYSAIVIEKKHV
jgi:cell division protein FtsN